MQCILFRAINTVTPYANADHTGFRLVPEHNGGMTMPRIYVGRRDFLQTIGTCTLTALLADKIK